MEKNLEKDKPGKELGKGHGKELKHRKNGKGLGKVYGKD